MIPHEIAELAQALQEEFQIDFDAAVDAAWRVYRTLQTAGLTLREQEAAQ